MASVPGIGADLAGKICAAGHSAALEQVEARTPTLLAKATDCAATWEAPSYLGAFTVKRSYAGAVFAMMLSGLVAPPTQSGQVELDLLTSYIGKWTGAGTLVGGIEPEPFRCRLTIAKGKQTKINYSGRCTLVNMNLSVAGTIAFDESAQRYVAVMSSNAGFTGRAIGQRRDGRISFDLAERRTDRGGSDVRIGSRINLIGDSITVDFEVEFNESGEILTASVPFSR